MTPPQSSRADCRNSLEVGYHGVSSRSINHRQSGTWGSRIHSGRPIPEGFTSVVAPFAGLFESYFRMNAKGQALFLAGVAVFETPEAAA